MPDFGKRLKDERERLCLTQAEMAEDCGVGKTAQYTYEKGSREPSASYIEAAGRQGADILYILTGKRSDDDYSRSHAESMLISYIESLLGLSENQAALLTYQRLELDNQKEVSKLLDKEEPIYSLWIDSVKKWLATSTTPDACFDLELFSTVLAEIEAAIEKAGVRIPPDKKTKAGVMLYRAFKASGKVDQKMIEDAIQLAAS